MGARFDLGAYGHDKGCIRCMMISWQQWNQSLSQVVRLRRSWFLDISSNLSSVWWQNTEPIAVTFLASNPIQTSTSPTVAVRSCFHPSFLNGERVLIQCICISWPKKGIQPYIWGPLLAGKGWCPTQRPIPPTCLHTHNGHFTARLGVMEPGWVGRDGSPPDGDEMGDLAALRRPWGAYGRSGDQNEMAEPRRSGWRLDYRTLIWNVV